MSAELYDRVASLIVAPISGAEGITIENLRFAFRIEKTGTSEANKANIKIYNLSELTRDWLQTKDQAVVLNAGYRDLNQRIFAGVIYRLEHRRENVDFISELECRDGGIDLSEPEFQRSYPPAIPKLRIIKDIINAMPHTGEGIISATGVAGSLAKKLSLTGSCKRILDKLAKSWSFSWSIQDGNMQILNPETGTLTGSDLAMIIKPDSGLVGTPTKTNRGMKCKTLLIPSIKPGTYITLESEFLTGHYKAESLIHEGDTHSAEWTTEIEGRKLT